MKGSKPHIVVAVTNDLVTDQRVHRTCHALVEAGYRITLVGRRLKASGDPGIRPYATERMRLLFRRSAWFYAEYNLRLWLKLMCKRADAFYANDTDTLLACTWAARLRRKKLLFDAHELFPDVPELVHKPHVQAVWKWIERHCLPRVDTAFTVCQSVADEYKRRYDVTMEVVRNVPERYHDDSVEPKETNDVKTILYQGAVNIGRGVCEIIDALEYLPQCRFVVAGDGDELMSMRRYLLKCPWGDRVTLLGRVEPDQLHRLTGTADLGVCLLEDLGLNYRYALPNRIADFAQAGVPILATDFPEIRRVIEEYGTGTLTEACPESRVGEDYRAYVRRLATTIQQALDYWGSLPADEKRRRFARAGEELCWEREKKILVNSVNAIMCRTRRYIDTSSSDEAVAGPTQ